MPRWWQREQDEHWWECSGSFQIEQVVHWRTVSHPQQSTIDLLHTLVDRLPPRFPRELGRYMIARVGELECDASVSHEALDRVVAEFGKYTWHYRRAWEEVYARAGVGDEEQRFLAALPSALRERAQVDAAAAGKRIGEVIRLPAFERYTPEDRLILEEALLRARRDASNRLGQRLLAGELPEYDATALRWKQERVKIEEQLLALDRIAHEKPALAEEIAKVVADYEVGFSGLMGREPTLTELRGVVADYTNRV